MKKPVGRLLYPNTGWYFAAMLLFTAAAAAVGQYILAGGALFVTLIMFIISRARLSRRKRQLMSYVQTATDSVGIFFTIFTILLVPRRDAPRARNFSASSRDEMPPAAFIFTCFST